MAALGTSLTGSLASPARLQCGEEYACAVDDALWAELPDYSNRPFRSLAKKSGRIGFPQ